MAVTARRQTTKPAAMTLPLFRNGLLPAAAPPRKSPASPLELALHVYWSAGVEAHALGAAAATAGLPSERRALGALQQLDLARKETARRLLDEVWGVKIPGGGDGNARAA